MNYYHNGRFYQIDNDQDFLNMQKGVELRKEELNKLKKKFFKNAQTLNDISSIELDIDGAEKSLSEYNTAKIKREKEELAKLFSFKEKVVGTSYHIAAVNKAIRFIDQDCALDKFEGLKNKEIENDGYEKVYKYADFYTKKFQLEPEPENKFDANAIKVMVEGNHIGYLPKETAEKVSSFLKKHNCLFSGILNITGGPYKEFDYVEDKIVTVKSDFGFSLNCVVLDEEILNK